MSHTYEYLRIITNLWIGTLWLANSTWYFLPKVRRLPIHSSGNTFTECKLELSISQLSHHCFPKLWNNKVSCFAAVLAVEQPNRAPQGAVTSHLRIFRKTTPDFRSHRGCFAPGVHFANRTRAPGLTGINVLINYFNVRN